MMDLLDNEAVVPRAEHLAWCKTRALEYVEGGDLAGAIASMMSDLTKHPQTAGSATALAPVAAFELAHGDAASVRRFVEGFA